VFREAVSLDFMLIRRSANERFCNDSKIVRLQGFLCCKKVADAGTGPNSIGF